MTPVDRVVETTTSTGTGPLDLTAAVAGFRRFNAIPEAAAPEQRTTRPAGAAATRRDSVVAAAAVERGPPAAAVATVAMDSSS